jgi:hypothetical protein
MNNKYEQLVEFIINDETDKARALFHTIVVEKSRDIYESLIEEEDLDETMGGNEVEDLVDEVTLDEEGLSEDDQDMMSMDDEESDDMDFDDSGDLDDHEEEHGDVEDRVQDLESALDELKAEFDALMAGEEAEEENFPGIHGDDDDNMGEQQFMEAETDEEDDEEELDETIVREYVEKVAAPANTEGSAVGTGKSVSVNKKSTVAGKNDMGGTAAFTKGGNQDQNGNRPTATEKPKGTLVSNPQNKPGANAGKTAFKTKETAKAGEGQTTGKAVGGVNTKSPLAR